MDPKEIANELISKFRDDNYFSETEILENGKFNALICIKEILNVIEEFRDSNFYYDEKEFYEKVKTEIENLKPS